MEIAERLAPVLAIAAEHAADVDQNARFPEEAVAALRVSGLLGLTLPTDLGGLGAGPAEYTQVVRQIATACGSTSMVYIMHVAAAMATASGGTADVVRRMANGSALGTLAFSEPGSRSHFWAPVSRATKDGEDYKLDAAKSWVTSADLCEIYVVSTQSTDGEGPSESDLFVVESSDSDFSVTGTFAGLGLRGNASSPMHFGTTVDESRRIGDPASGFSTMMQVVLPWFNLGNSSVSLGLASGALTAAIGHVAGSKMQHLGSTLADLPTIRAKVAKSALELASAEEYVNKAAIKVASPEDDTIMFVLGSKALSNDMAIRVTDEAMRVCGGAAFSKHLPIERQFRDARAGLVMAPTADVLYDFYGKALCGMELF